MESAFALVHSRFSTNTLGSWKLAHPYRYIIHNGEINTLQGNINWMTAREKNFRSETLGDDVGKLLPIVTPSRAIPPRWTTPSRRCWRPGAPSNTR